MISRLYQVSDDYYCAQFLVHIHFLISEVSSIFTMYSSHNPNTFQFLMATIRPSQDSRNLLSLRVLFGVKTLSEEGFPDSRSNINVRLSTLYVIHKTC